jgi:hypothetical protein
MDLPWASAAVQPKICSAAGFQSSTIPSGVSVMMAAGVARLMAA